MIGRSCKAEKSKLSRKTPSSVAPSPKNATTIFLFRFNLFAQAMPVPIGMVLPTIGTAAYTPAK